MSTFATSFSHRRALVFAMAAFGLVAVVAASEIQLETPRVPQRDQRLEFPLAGQGSAFRFRFADVKPPARQDNAAALQLQVDKTANKFLSTLTPPGSSQFLTVLKPCGMILPHVHQRATEFYSILSGKMSAGIAQENGALQNITFTVEAGEVFIAPQGLLHFNLNRECHANAFFQTFNSADAGALNVIGALTALGKSGDIGAAAIKASTAQGLAPDPTLGAFALDQECLHRCHLKPKDLEGDAGLKTLPHAIKKLFGK